MKYLITGLLIFIACHHIDEPPEHPTPTPTPSPTATPTPAPTPFDEMTLHTAGSNFYDPKNNKIYLTGVSICCDDPQTKNVDDGKLRGWPWITKSDLSEAASHGANFAVIRLGPFTEQGEGAEFAPYKKVGNKYDLYNFDNAYWDRLKDLILHARSLGVYLQVSVSDAWIMERPDLSPWSIHNNIQGLDEGDCKQLKFPPFGIHEFWIRKVARETGFFDNIFFEVTNESFDCWGQGTSSAWEIGVAKIIRDELGKNNYPLKPIGSNSEMGMLEESEEFEYVIRHSENVQPPKNNSPVVVNEYSGRFAREQGADGYYSNLKASYKQNTSWILWSGEMSLNEYRKALEKLKMFREEIE